MTDKGTTYVLRKLRTNRAPAIDYPPPPAPGKGGKDGVIDAEFEETN